MSHTLHYEQAALRACGQVDGSVGGAAEPESLGFIQ